MKTLLLAFLATLGLAAQAAAPLPVVASFSILGDLVHEVGGDKVAVTTLVGPDGDAHVYQPTPQDGRALAGARLLVVNGLGFEGWIDRLARASAYKGPRVVASAKVVAQQMEADEHEHGHDDHDHGRLDPHAWQDPARVRQYVANIAAGLAAADPANAAYYKVRAADYDRSLRALEQWAAEQIGSIPPAQRKVITSHDAFGYLGRRFGIAFLAPQGVSTDSEASARMVGALIRQIRQERIGAVFVENISNPKLLEQIGRETGVQIGAQLYSDALSGPAGPASTYLTMMRYNIGQLVAGMKRNR
ncbi:metal ABC transporter solute-binding protein, Zn/Mn family [Chitinimonas koreensis]|uniref:metal ABC transporter solute-binding protein, Zn/Mn family n=1 Tax=Chitinimonas koreensis TaxID=356302 RepID=UPI00048F45EC|nr:zinc ABC transporter substrate-binding protein [Chitinimonas koreensis]QNM95809.1 zinc ABC transporter substrate-binding protein [Chitinimonas koreensis]